MQTHPRLFMMKFVCRDDQRTFTLRSPGRRDSVCERNAVMAYARFQFLIPHKCPAFAKSQLPLYSRFSKGTPLVARQNCLASGSRQG